MAQAGSSPYQEDPSLNDEGEKNTSFIGKLKNKGRKLKTKLKSPKGAGDATSESSSDEDEGNTPTGAGAIQEGAPKSGYISKGADEVPSSESQEPPIDSSTNFPGNFAGIEKEAASDDSGLSKDFEGLSTNDQSGVDDRETTPTPKSSLNTESKSSKPVGDSIQDNVISAKDQTQEKIFGGGVGSEQTSTSPDAPSVPEKAQEVGGAAEATGKSWGQWAAEKVGYAKDTTAAKAPSTEDGIPVHEKAYDTTANTAAGSKDTVVGKAAEAKDSADQYQASIPSDPAQQTYGQKATGGAYAAKDALFASKDAAVGKAAEVKDSADQYNASIPSDPAKQTYVQKATGGIYAAKDSLFTSTQPGDEHKALSQKVTETVGNLPATFKSSLGFGKGGATSPTTTSDATPDSTPSTTEESAAAPQSPGLVSRFTTGLFGAKKPATETFDSTSAPTSQESGTQGQDATI